MTEIVNQNKSENITRELDTTGIIVYWKQGSWKTILSLELAFENREKRIYSNFSIYKNNVKINIDKKGAKDILNIRFSNIDGVVIIDEAGINANSKDGRSTDNRDLIEALFLARKFNCSFIWISQRFWSIDVNARELTDLIIEMHKIRRGEKHPLFIASRKKQKGSKMEMINQFKIDTIELMKFDKLTYNTLETSKFTSWKEIKIKRKKVKEGESWKITRVDIND